MSFGSPKAVARSPNDEGAGRGRAVAAVRADSFPPESRAHYADGRNQKRTGLLPEGGMRIESISLAVLDLPGRTALFSMTRGRHGERFYWRKRPAGPAEAEIHVLHVRTDEGVEGVSTVGDARHSTMRPHELEQLRLLVVGEDALDREGLARRLQYATRFAFVNPGWFGALDNCLWDIAGKCAGQPVCELMGRRRERAEAYYNIASGVLADSLADADRAREAGFRALKDHYAERGIRNAAWLRQLRSHAGPEVDLMHDAAGCQYTVEEALHIGRTLQEQEFRWFEEPVPDRRVADLQRLCRELEVPILALETLMHDVELARAWLHVKATDLVRANARVGATSLLALAKHAARLGTNVELNGPGGLFGLLHAHLAVALPNTSRYEYFPDGSRDELGREIGLLNPPVPVSGFIAPPCGPGWGAEWDWRRYRAKTRAVL